MAAAQLSSDNVTRVGTYEMNLRKSDKALNVFAGLMTKRELSITPSKDASVCVASPSEFQRHNGHAKVVWNMATKISDDNMKGVSTTSGIHVIQDVIKACHGVRKAESRNNAGTLKQAERNWWKMRKN